MELVQYILANSSTFLFVFARTASILLTAPVFGAMLVPMPLKMGLSMVLAVILTPLTPFVPMPQTLAGLVVSMAGEMMIGVIMGLAIRFVLTGIEYAGQIASFQMGIGMASAYDPMNSAQVTILGRLFSILTLLIFLSLNGHLMVIMALGKSFEVIPPYGFSLSTALMDNFIQFSREIFVLALKFSAPIVAILIFANLGLGILARVVPQLNMFVIGFAVTIGVGFIVLALSMPAFEAATIKAFERMWEGVFNLMKVMGNA